MQGYVFLFVALMMALQGCASEISPLPYKLYSTPDLRFYEPAEIQDAEYTSLGIVEGVDCSLTWFRIARSENALRKLIAEANKLSATGVINTMCVDSGLRVPCQNSVTCTAEAVSVK